MFKLRSGNKPEFRELSGVASPNKKVDATAVTDKLKDKVASVASVKDKVSSVKDKVKSVAKVKDKVASVKGKVANVKSKALSTKEAVGKVGKKLATKGVTKGAQRALTSVGRVGTAGALGTAGAAMGLGGAAAGILKGHADMPNLVGKETAKSLSAGAYGMQSNKKGSKNLRGTFFGSMK
jgi:hypothetical protein